MSPPLLRRRVKWKRAQKCFIRRSWRGEKPGRRFNIPIDVCLRADCKRKYRRTHMYLIIMRGLLFIALVSPINIQH